MSTLDVFIHSPGCTVPATLSTDRSESSHGVPVLVMAPGGSYPREVAFGPADVTDHGLAACLVLGASESDEERPMECNACGKALAGLRAGDDCPDDGCEGRVYYVAAFELLDAWNAACADVRSREGF